MLNKSLLSPEYEATFEPAASPILGASTVLGSRNCFRSSGQRDIVNVLSIDVEDYFHPSELGGNVSSWTTYPPRVGVGLSFLLDLLAAHQVRATFFVLGWVAMRHPHLIRRIAEAGHEIGCHSHCHRLVYSLTPDEFQRDTLEAVKAIRDASGVTPRMYRAPSYSVTSNALWALDILASCGFTHDSSIYPIVHDRYGIPGFPRHASYIATPSGGILEIPVATVQLGRRVMPVGGGAYMRLFPYRYMAAGLRRINCQEKQPACLYLHPWELDPEQPRLTRRVISRLRTYTGLAGMRDKMSRLLDDFAFAALTDVFPLPNSVQIARMEARETLTPSPVCPAHSRPGSMPVESVSYYRSDIRRTCD